MKTHKIKSLQQYTDIIDSYGEYGYIFRGQKKTSYKLVNSVSRYLNVKSPHSNRILFPSDNDLIRKELDILRLFGSEYCRYTNEKLVNKWEMIATAQHHKCPTRFMDWSLSPLIALYFAVEHYDKEDAVVYSYNSDAKWIDELNTDLHNLDPFTLSHECIYIPRHADERLRAQQGVFLIQPCIDTYKELNNNNIERIEIDTNYRQFIKQQLYTMGISSKTVYPDLDGLGQYFKEFHFEGI